MCRGTCRRRCVVGTGSHGEGGQEILELPAADVDLHAGGQSGRPQSSGLGPQLQNKQSSN